MRKAWTSAECRPSTTTATGRKRGKINIFRFVLDGVVFCHLGDLGHMLDEATIAELLPIDVLFLPVGGVFTIDGKQARELIGILRPKVAVPMHFRDRRSVDVDPYHQ